MEKSHALGQKFGVAFFEKVNAIFSQGAYPLLLGHANAPSGRYRITADNHYIIIWEKKRRSFVVLQNNH